MENKIFTKLLTPSPIQSLARNVTNTDLFLAESSPAPSTKKETSVAQLSLLILSQEKKRIMETSSMSALEFAIPKESGSMRLKKDKLSLKEKLNPSYITAQLNSSSWLPEMSAGRSPTRLSISWFTQSPQC